MYLTAINVSVDDDYRVSHNNIVIRKIHFHHNQTFHI
nr:MAG TPA: hypothetical protein [Bacteriophage sp.]